MRRTASALVATATGIALLVGVRAQSAGAFSASASAPPRTGREAAGASGSRPGADPTVGTGAAGHYVGSAVGTRYGTVQVEAVLRGGRLTDVTVLQRTQGRRSDQVDSHALPVLRAEALAAQGPHIDAVSGASYTSAAYIQSLQAALDQAGLGSH